LKRRGLTPTLLHEEKELGDCIIVEQRNKDDVEDLMPG
jgi:hypothetical protein